MRHHFLILVFLFLLQICASANKFKPVHAESLSTIVVPDDYLTIQDAINAASEGATIIVKNGTYNENLLTIAKSLKIYGSENDTTIIKNPSGGDVVYIRANGVVFARFTIEGTAGSFGKGIHIQQSHDNQILNNTVVGNNYGIYIWDSSNITLRNNNMTGNRYNFGVWGLFLSHFLHNIDDSNVVDGKPVCYWINEKNKTVPNNVGYVALVNSTNIAVEDLTLTKNYDGIIAVYSTSITIQNLASINNYYGIHLVSSNRSTIIQNDIQENQVGILLDLSSHNDIVRNNFSDNWVGLQFSYSPLVPEKRSVGNSIHENNITHNDDGIQILGALSNSIHGNEITANTRFGILLSKSSNNIFYENTFSENKWGFAFQNSSQNLAFNNNFVNNTSHVYADSSINWWNSTHTIGGNYWSNNTITDIDHDGISDSPYVINQNNKDNHPLAGIISNHPFTWENNEYFLTIISNSSKRAFKFSSLESKMSLNFTGPIQTSGFCRISLQKEPVQSLWGGNLTILVNGLSPSNMTKWEDDSCIYIYLAYPHPWSQVSIAPKSSNNTFLALFLSLFLITIFLITVLLIKRKKSKDSTRSRD